MHIMIVAQSSCSMVLSTLWEMGYTRSVFTVLPMDGRPVACFDTPKHVHPVFKDCSGEIKLP